MKKIFLAAIITVLAMNCFCLAKDISGIPEGITITAATQAAADVNPGKVIAGLSMWALIWGLLFNSVGVFAFLYGKKRSNVTYIIIGVLLVAYPYVVQQAILVFIIGALLTAALYVFRK
jgi:hypothetical protein